MPEWPECGVNVKTTVMTTQAVQAGARTERSYGFLGVFVDCRRTAKQGISPNPPAATKVKTCGGAK